MHDYRLIGVDMYLLIIIDGLEGDHFPKDVYGSSAFSKYTIPAMTHCSLKLFEQVLINLTTSTTRTWSYLLVSIAGSSTATSMTRMPL